MGRAMSSASYSARAVDMAKVRATGAARCGVTARGILILQLRLGSGI